MEEKTTYGKLKEKIKQAEGIFYGSLLGSGIGAIAYHAAQPVYDAANTVSLAVNQAAQNWAGLENLVDPSHLAIGAGAAAAGVVGSYFPNAARAVGRGTLKAVSKAAYKAGKGAVWAGKRVAGASYAGLRDALNNRETREEVGAILKWISRAPLRLLRSDLVDKAESDWMQATYDICRERKEDPDFTKRLQSIRALESRIYDQFGLRYKLFCAEDEGNTTQSTEGTTAPGA